MSAGMNVRFAVWRIHEMSDDYVGGASVSGTLIYPFVQGRFEKQRTSQVFLEQGLETERLFTAQLIPGTLDIRERDELELVAPIEHSEFQHRFRVVDVSRADFNPRDPRNYINLMLSRSVVAHGQQ